MRCAALYNALRCIIYCVALRCIVYCVVLHYILLCVALHYIMPDEAAVAIAPFLFLGARPHHFDRRDLRRKSTAHDLQQTHKQTPPKEGRSLSAVYTAALCGAVARPWRLRPRHGEPSTRQPPSAPLAARTRRLFYAQRVRLRLWTLLPAGRRRSLRSAQSFLGECSAVLRSSAQFTARRCAVRGCAQPWLYSSATDGSALRVSMER